MSLRPARFPAALPPAALFLVLAAVVAAPPAAAQGPEAYRDGDRDGRRLFQRFAQDAAIIPGGWVEGVVTYDNQRQGSERFFAGGQFAFRLGERSEAGLRLGWARQESDGGPDGTGLADIDLYGKHRFRGGGGHCAAGGLLKAATADDEDGIGTGVTDLEGFVACRGDFAAVSLAGSLGARYNGDPDPPLPEANASLLAGGAIIIPAGARLTFVIEATWESERLDGAGSDSRLTLGCSGAGPDRGFGLRGAVAVPLADGAPDYQVLFGAAWLY